MLKQTAILVGLLALGTSAHAGSQGGTGLSALPHGVYLGVGAGASTAEVDIEGFGTLIDTNQVGWKAFAGYRFNQNLSAEVFYLDSGNHEERGGTAAAGIDPRYWGVAAIGTWPLKDNFGVFARIGYADWKTNLFFRDSGDPILSAHQSGNDLIWGAGIETSLDGALVRIGYEAANIGKDPLDIDLTLISLDVSWFF